MTTQEVSAWNTARRMIAHGLRPPIVHAVTGLCPNRLRQMFAAIHGRSAKQGRVPRYAYSMLKTRHQVMEAAAYYQIYHRLGGDQIFRQALSPDLVLTAYETYQLYSTKGIDASSAWAVAQDLRENSLEPKTCRKCGWKYLYDWRSDLMSRCPLCGD